MFFQRCRLIDEVNGLVWQEPVGDVPLEKLHGSPNNLITEGHVVVGLVVAFDPSRISTEVSMEGSSIVTGWTVAQVRRPFQSTFGTR
jgi:hypothetical protein